MVVFHAREYLKTLFLYIYQKNKETFRLGNASISALVEPLTLDHRLPMNNHFTTIACHLLVARAGQELVVKPDNCSG